MDKPVRKRSFRDNMITYVMVVAAYVIMQVLLRAGSISSALQGQLVPICAYIVMAISLNLTVGILGELSLGHAGFMSVGAFAGVIAGVSLQNLIPFDPLRLAISIVIGAFFAGVAGAFYAGTLGMLTPGPFNFMKSINILVMVVLGGMGSMMGSVIAASILTALPLLMQGLNDYRLIIYALMLIIVMIFKPSGLMGTYDFSLSRILEKAGNWMITRGDKKGGVA